MFVLESRRWRVFSVGVHATCLLTESSGDARGGGKMFITRLTHFHFALGIEAIIPIKTRHNPNEM